MSKYRTAIRFLFIALLALPLSAFAANYDVKALIDTDNSRSTGCPVALPDGSTVTGIDTILTTSVTVTGTTGTVTAVTRQTCSGGSFGGPVPVDNGWHVGVSPAGDLLIESHLGPNVITMNNVGSPRFVFTTTSSGLLFDTLLQPNTTGGGDIIMRQAGRDRAVTPRPPRTIVLDGIGSDWAGDVPLANGTDNHPALRFISVNAYAGLTDLYFNFQIHTNPAAPTAHDDLYDLPTLGGTLSVATLGVLNNDNPNGQSITAVQVDNPQHGTVVLSPNGGFVYSNDGAHVQQDQFHYFANGLLPSNIATVTIDMSGTKYVFTSADHVTFTSGVPSSFTVTVTGKPTPALSEDGALPAGVTFVDNGDGTGTLSGTPTPAAVGTYPLVFHAEKNKPHQADQSFTLTVACGGITVFNPAQSSFQAGVPLSQAFQQNGGIDPITWSESGALPPGLSFNTTTGVLSGTPTQSGTFPITVTAHDANGCSGTGSQYNLIIICPAITVTNPVVTTGTVNVAFSQTFTQSGGFGTTTFSLFSGTLPAGLTLNPSTGVLSGTPTQTGSFPIVVRATDSHGCTGNGPAYTLVIGCQVITVTNPATTTGTVNIAFSQTFAAGNAIAPVTFTLNSGTLPAGITLSSAGVLSGAPTQTGSFPITVKATDANGCTGIGATYTLVIGCQVITVTNPATNSGT
ncbi:MAG TPA: putative Ig domain-containing protein, partial [Thermoanaerobaculia bacterium]|nr:putative Ig domain-containing protein [Thermoanaerobaculia bacterium]